MSEPCRILCGLLILLFVGVRPAVADPVLSGIGINDCQRLLETRRAADAGEPRAVAREIRYRSWLAGFASGLALAADDDVLRGVPLEGVMRQIAFRCERHPGQRFAAVATEVIAGISRLPPLSPPAR